VALFPVAVAQTYLTLPAMALAAMVAVVVAAQKILLARKASDIFFAHSGAAPHTLIYFVTLELLPIAMLITALGACREAMMIEP